jgi:cytochrome d ubiquinol oxidase subunit I
MAAAASEAHYETQNPADFSVIAGFDKNGNEMYWSLTIPKGLSLLYYFKPSGTVEGLNNLQAEFEARYGPGDYIPPVVVDFWMFRIMVGLGFLMVAIAAIALFYAVKRYPEKRLRWVKWLIPAIFLPYLANTSGWILTETARQPWVVTGLMLTKDAISPNLTLNTVLISLIGFVLIYAILMGFDIFLLVRNAKKGLAAGDFDSISLEDKDEVKVEGGKK